MLHARHMKSGKMKPMTDAELRSMRAMQESGGMVPTAGVFSPETEQMMNTFNREMGRRSQAIARYKRSTFV